MTAETGTTVITRSAEETLAWAESFARALRPGSVIALTGELGAGKTVIAKGIGRGLDVPEEVISPSYNYVIEYKGRLPLYHADLYRIEDAGVFTGLGLDEYFDREGVFVIEWAEKIRGLLPPETVHIELKITEQNNSRRITVRQGEPCR